MRGRRELHPFDAAASHRNSSVPFIAMKHIQVIDGAENCSYSICLVSDRDFRTIFPRKGQDIEFAEDLAKRVGNKRAGQIIIRSTTRRLRKHTVQGIHGTLFFQLKNRRKYYPNKRDDDIDMPRFVNDSTS